MQEISCFVIDDDVDDRDFFEIAVENSNLSCKVTMAENGIEALGMLSSMDNLPDFIFLDLNMPLLSGKECLKEIRAIRTLENIPVIIFSTSSYHKDIDETKELGATYFLSKTPDIDKLSIILGNIMSGKELPYVLS